MSGEPETPDPDLPQDPGIPGPKAPEELPAERDEGSAPGPFQSEPEVEEVPDVGHPETDDEGHMAP